MLEVHIKVTREHIDKGIAVNCQKCPVALAVQEAFPKAWIHVGADVVSMGPITYNLPHHITKWIDEFDQGIPMIPTSFKLEFENDELDIIHSIDSESYDTIYVKS